MLFFELTVHNRTTLDSPLLRIVFLWCQNGADKTAAQLTINE